MATLGTGNDLPALVAERDLPMPLAGVERRHEPPPRRVHPGWSTLATQVEIRGIAVGRDLWLATAGGVLRWSRELDRYTRYGSEHGLAGQATRAIALDAAQRVWSLSDSGRVAVLEADGFALHQTGEPVACLATGPAGEVWVATEVTVAPAAGGEGTPAPGIAARTPARALAIATDNAAWLACVQGLLHWDGLRWSVLSSRPDVLALALGDELLWMGTGRGLEALDPATGEWLRADPWPRAAVRALHAHGDGVWVDAGGAIGRATPNGWAPLRVPAAPSTDRVTAIAAGEGDEVLIGTPHGLLRAEGGALVPVQTDAPPDVIGQADGRWPPSSFANLVQALAVERTQTGSRLWIGTTRGLFAIEPAADQWRQVAGNLVSDVRAIWAGSAPGGGWVGSWRGGLRPLVDTVGGAAPGVHGPIVALTPGADGAMWAASLEIVYRCRDDHWERAGGLPAVASAGCIQALAPDAAGGAWLGSSAGLLRLDGLGLSAVWARGALASADIRALAVIAGPDGDELWAGTSRGLYRRADTDAVPVRGLHGRTVTALLGDRERNLVWAGTDTGLFRLEQAADGWELTAAMTPEDSGLAGPRVTALALGASDGGAPRLWIGTTNGLSAYDDAG